jgi:NADH-quinone oxidoreductase subunit E
MPLTDDTRARAREIIARYPRSRSALLPMLHLVQAEEGYVSQAGVTLCAEELGLTKAEVGAVATFYTMYKRRPCGEYLVSVCTNLSCQILGGEEVYARLSKHLGVGHDQTTEDGTFTLEHAECLAACDYAPVMTVNYEFFDNVTADSGLALVEALQRGERPEPTRGEPLVGFREISMQLAGFLDLPEDTAKVGSAAPAHPDAPAPVDDRGSEPLEGSDVAPAAHGDFGVPGGVTERVLTPPAAAATYGGQDADDDAAADAGRTPLTGEGSPRRQDSDTEPPADATGDSVDAGGSDGPRKAPDSDEAGS